VLTELEKVLKIILIDVAIAIEIGGTGQLDANVFDTPT